MKIVITEEQFKLLKEVSVKSSDRIKIYEDERILVVVPLTHKASCKYGSNTPWCISVPSNDEHFNHYIDEGVIIQFIIKSPYPESKIKEYKFAYFHPYGEDSDGLKGWYDMGDFQYVDDDNEDPEAPMPPDKKLIKFLIPDFIFKKVKEFIKTQAPVFMKKRKEKKMRLVQKFLSDPDNIKIGEDNEWVVFKRDEMFVGLLYLPELDYFPTIMKDKYLMVLYVNKHGKGIFHQHIQFYNDIRCWESNSRARNDFMSLNRISDIETFDGGNNEMFNVFEKFYPLILKAYFHNRKKYFSGKGIFSNEGPRIYMPTEFVTTYDYYDGSPPSRIVSITKDNQGRYRLYYENINPRWNEEKIKEAYVSDTHGVAIVYDKERHNPE